MILDPPNKIIYTITSACPVCHTGKLVPKRSVVNGGLFLGCSRYPACNGTSAFEPALDSLTATMVALEEQVAALTKRLEDRRHIPTGRTAAHLKVVK